MTFMKTKTGFTLVETLVAITILLLAIGGPMFAVSQSLKSSYYARDQITAFYLAQDAIEYIRNLRDENALTGGTWSDFTSMSGGPISDCIGLTCRVDSSDNKIEPCSDDHSGTTA